MKTLIRTEGRVGDLQQDRFIRGNFLFADEHALKTTDGKNTYLIAGNARQSGYYEGVGSAARFFWVSNIFHINNKKILIADVDNHCLRTVNRWTNRTNPFVGKCREAGFRDGYDARFYYPHAMVQDPKIPELVYITDRGNNAVRFLNVLGKQVATLTRSGLNQPTGISLDYMKKHLLISGIYYVTRFNLETKQSQLVTGEPSGGFRDGWMQNVLYNWADDVLALSTDVILIADRHNHRLRVASRNRDDVCSICRGSGDNYDGDIWGCAVDYPLSFLLVGEELYVGAYQAIRRLPG